LTLLLCFALLCQPLHTQTASSQEKIMKHYALVFHSTRTLSPEELKQRGVAIAAWVKQVTEMGITLDPRILGETVGNFSTQGNEIVSRKESSDPTFRNVLFFDSSSSDQALNIARTHPGLHYGSTVEVREWTSPRETAARQ